MSEPPPLAGQTPADWVSMFVREPFAGTDRGTEAEILRETDRRLEGTLFGNFRSQEARGRRFPGFFRAASAADVIPEVIITAITFPPRTGGDGRKSGGLVPEVSSAFPRAGKANIEAAKANIEAEKANIETFPRGDRGENRSAASYTV